MVNATEMAKLFGKTTKDWLRTNTSSEFINPLSVVKQIRPSQLIVIEKGNSNEFEQGTWIHEDVVLEFARWLSPAFIIWCNGRIEELLKYGMTATQPTLDEALNNPNLVIRMATQLKQECAEKTRLEAENVQTNERISLQGTQLKQQALKVKSYGEHISSDGTFTTTQIAKEYDWGAKTPNSKLKERGVRYKQNRQWLLTVKYDGKGYTRSIPCTFTYNDDAIGTLMQTVWTTKGHEFIHSLFDAT